MTTPARYPTYHEVRVRIDAMYGCVTQAPSPTQMIDIIRHAIDIEREMVAKEAGECSVTGLADDLRLVAKLESKRMGAMSSGLLKGVIDRLSALPPPPAEGSQS